MSHADCDPGTSYCSHLNLCLGCIVCRWAGGELPGAGSCEGWCRLGPTGLGSDEIPWVAALYAADPAGNEQELTPEKIIGRLATAMDPDPLRLYGRLHGRQHGPAPAPSIDGVRPSGDMTCSADDSLGGAGGRAYHDAPRASADSVAVPEDGTGP